MTEKWTKGPWFRSQNRAEGRAYGIHANNGGGRLNIVNWGGLSRSGSDDGQANANLICAAPELYQCLSNIVTLFESDIKRGAPAQLEAARAALALARGETSS